MKQQSQNQRVKSAYTNSRMRDNHYDPNVHTKAWIATGIVNQPPKYEHLDSGLVVLQPKTSKMKNYKELSEINQEIEISKNKSEMRKFKEFENLSNGDLVITIEYCTNCSQHNSSTRHDEEKYYNHACSLKQEVIAQYPTAKIYLKPLLYDPHDHSSESLYLQRRIGAFEVQVCSKHGGHLKQGLVFSKLNQKMWPNYQEVIDRISYYLNTANLTIYLHFPEGIEGSLNNVEVTLTPHRNNDQRPQSSVSRHSTNRTYNKRCIKAQSNHKGVIQIQDVPIDSYVVHVAESNDYQSEEVLLDMSDMENAQQMEFTIQLKKQNHAFIEISVTNMPSEGKVMIIDPQTQEFMYTREIQKGKYEAVVEPGEYQISIECNNSEPYLQTINVKNGANQVSVQLQIKQQQQQQQRPPSVKQLQPLKQSKPGSARPISATESKKSTKQQQQPQQQLQSQYQQQQVSQPPPLPPNVVMEDTKTEDAQQSSLRPISGFKTTIVFVYDPYTNQPIQGVTITLNEESTKQSTSYTTDAEGTCKIILQGVLEGKMSITNPHYFPILEEYGTTPNKMNLYQLRELSFPLISQPQVDSSVYILVQTNVEVMPIDLKIIMPDDVQVDNTHQNVHFDFNDESGCLKIEIKDLNTKRGVFRIMADIIEPEYVHPQTLKLYVITNKDLKLVDVPKNLTNELLYWDIGVICAPNPVFLEINTPTNELLRRDKYLKDYQSLIKFLKNSKNMDLKTILGFTDKERLELQGDVYVQREKIHQSLDKYGFEAIKNLDYLIYSAMQLNGLFSFKKLESKFNNLDFEFIFEDENSTSKQKEESDDEPYEDDYEL